MPLKSLFDPPEERFETSNSLSYLDLEKMTWVQCEYNDDICPSPRAGHSQVTVRNRIYLWGGRSNYSRSEDNSFCTKDFWYLETEVPQKISNITLIRPTKTTLEIKWDEIDNAECYIVEIHKVHAAPIDLSKIRIKTVQKIEPDQNKATSLKRKLSDLEVMESKKFITEETKDENKAVAVEKSIKTDDKKAEVDENKNVIETNNNDDSPVKSDSPIKNDSPIKVCNF